MCAVSESIPPTWCGKRAMRSMGNSTKRQRTCTILVVGHVSCRYYSSYDTLTVLCLIRNILTAALKIPNWLKGLPKPPALAILGWTTTHAPQRSASRCSLPIVLVSCALCLPASSLRHWELSIETEPGNAQAPSVKHGPEGPARRHANLTFCLSVRGVAWAAGNLYNHSF